MLKSSTYDFIYPSPQGSPVVKFSDFGPIGPFRDLISFLQNTHRIVDLYLKQYQTINRNLTSRNSRTYLFTSYLKLSPRRMVELLELGRIEEKIDRVKAQIPSNQQRELSTRPTFRIATECISLRDEFQLRVTAHVSLHVTEVPGSMAIALLDKLRKTIDADDTFEEYRQMERDLQADFDETVERLMKAEETGSVV